MGTRRSAGSDAFTLAKLISPRLFEVVAQHMETDMYSDRLTDWLSSVHQLSTDLGHGLISPLQWQEGMDAIYGNVPLQRLLLEIKFDRLAAEMLAMPLETKGEIFRDIPLRTLPEHDPRRGSEPSNVLITKVAHVKRDRCIPPHGHGSMVSAFLCLSGEFHVRLFDRVDDLGGKMAIRQTADDPHARTGSWSSVSDYRDNVHWLTAKTDDCFLLTMKLIRVEPHKQYNSRIYLDLDLARHLGSGALLVPKISGDEARAKY